MAASILRAETYGITIPDWVKSPLKFCDAVNNVNVPDFQPKKYVKIVTDEVATSLSTAFIDDSAIMNELIMKLEMCRDKLPLGFEMNPIQFEKMLVDDIGDVTITNDGPTILMMLDVEHPSAKVLVE